MSELVITLLTFSALIAAAFGALMLSRRLPAQHVQEETNATVRIVANIFGVMTSLVLGFMINSAKNTFELIDHNLHIFATDIIVLDRALRGLGPDGDESRAHLLGYLKQALTDVPLDTEDLAAEGEIRLLGESLAAIVPDDALKTELWNDARQLYWDLVQQRWVVIAQSEGDLPWPIVAIVIAWLILIFASFGYRAPLNAVTAGSLVTAALLISATIYLILDMDQPFSGPVQISDHPLKHALGELQS